METQARDFAAQAHGSQKYGELPYLVHLDSVHANLVRWNASLPTRISGFLHDVVEDTNVGVSEIAHEFGSAVAATVLSVTKMPGESAPSWLGRVREGGPDSVLVKLADRLANVAAAKAPGRERYLAKYRAEQPLFAATLKIPGEFEGPWAELEAALGG